MKIKEDLFEMYIRLPSLYSEMPKWLYDNYNPPRRIVVDVVVIIIEVAPTLVAAEFEIIFAEMFTTVLKRSTIYSAIAR